MSSPDPSSNELVPKLDPEMLQVRWTLGGLRPEDLVSYALSALAQGQSGLALQALAGLSNPTLADLGDLPERVFSEMGLTQIDKRRAVDILVARGGLSRNGIFRSLLATFPAFTERWREHIEWWGGEPAGDYNDMAEFVHFVVEELEGKERQDDVRAAFEFMEKQLQICDQDTRELIGLGFFETLQNVASHKPGGGGVYEQYLGPISSQVWKQLQQLWQGKSSLADVIRAERQ